MREITTLRLNRSQILVFVAVVTFVACSPVSAPGGLTYAEAAPVSLPRQVPPPELTDEVAMTTERVIVFKDGYSLFVKRGITRTNAKGEAFSLEVPDAAVLGSFWAIPTEGRLISMTAGKRTRAEVDIQSVPCLQHIDVLRENIGATASIELDRQQVLEGRIGRVLTENTTSPVPVPAFHQLAYGATSFRPEVHAREVASSQGNLFVLETAAGDTLLPVGRITRLTIPGMKTDCERETKTTQTTKRLTFFFEEPNVNREIMVMYFVPDLRWIPTYRAELPAEDSTGSARRARLSLQAELLNEREDLVDVPVELVVGVPHFRFKKTVSPFSLESTLRTTLEQVAPQLMSQSLVLSNASFDTRSSEISRVGGVEPERSSPEIELPLELGGSSSHDLFIYSLPKLTLRKGDRAAVPIFSTDVPIHDVYTLDLHIKRSGDQASSFGPDDGSPLELGKNKVWHQIIFSNRTSVPWTTGPIMFFQDQRPLGQELMTYTPPGRDVRVPVTVSVDTRGTYHERETSRTLNARQVNKASYARLDTEGTVRLVNSKKGAVNMEVTARFGGQVDSISHNGSATRSSFDRNDWTNFAGSPELNGRADVGWSVSLAPGETVSLSMNYHYFLRH